MVKRVIWKGYFNGSTGYINASKIYPLACSKSFETAILPFEKLEKGNPLESMVLKGPIQKDDLVILHQIPTVSPNERGIFTVTEFDIPPHEWWNTLRNAKVILTQSQFCKNSFAKIGGVDQKKIGIVYAPIQEEIWKTNGQLDPNYKVGNKGLGDYDFIFGSCFEWVCRKKPELMWQAFQEEFPMKDYPNVAFINKMNIPIGFRDWKFRLPKDPRIAFLFDSIPNMGDFYRTLDCYMSPTAGEGFGLTLAEAMACGTPTIGSKHSGNLEFMNNKNSWLCDMDDWIPIGSDPTNKLWMVHDYQRWKLPQVTSIREQMRDVYEGRNMQRLEQAKLIRDSCGFDNIVKQIHNGLVEYL